MKKIFPNIETAIIFVFLIIVMLWGVSKCNKKKTDISATLPGSESMSYDSLGSPAARNIKTTPATLPQQAVTPTEAPPPQYTTTVTTPPPTTPAQIAQQTLPQTTTTVSATPPKTPSAPPVTVVQPTSSAPVTTNALTPLYVLQNGLNVRTKPDLKAKSLGKLKLNDQVYYLNEVTETPETVRLIDGTEVSKPWFKIKTKRGTIGWVHGSGVDFYKRKL